MYPAFIQGSLEKQMELEAYSQIERNYSSEEKNEITVWLLNFLRINGEAGTLEGFQMIAGNFVFPLSSKEKVVGLLFCF